MCDMTEFNNVLVYSMFFFGGVILGFVFGWERCKSKVYSNLKGQYKYFYRYTTEPVASFGKPEMVKQAKHTCGVLNALCTILTGRKLNKDTK